MYILGQWTKSRVLFEYLQLLYTTTHMYVVFDHLVFRAMSVGNEDAMAFFRGDEILCYLTKHQCTGVVNDVNL